MSEHEHPTVQESGDIDTGVEVADEDEQAGSQTATTDGSPDMTAAEQSGQVSYGSTAPGGGEEGATGAESSSG